MVAQKQGGQARCMLAGCYKILCLKQRNLRQFKQVRSRCYSVHISEREAINLAAFNLAKPLKDVAFSLEFNSLAHMAQKLAKYEQLHPELYQEKFKRINMIEVQEDSSDDDNDDPPEVALVEWNQGMEPLTCK